jgi:hypothetical protein
MKKLLFVIGLMSLIGSAFADCAADCWKARDADNGVCNNAYSDTGQITYQQWKKCLSQANDKDDSCIAGCPKGTQGY